MSNDDIDISDLKRETSVTTRHDDGETDPDAQSFAEEIEASERESPGQGVSSFRDPLIMAFFQTLEDRPSDERASFFLALAEQAGIDPDEVDAAEVTKSDAISWAIRGAAQQTGTSAGDALQRAYELRTERLIDEMRKGGMR